MPILHAKASRNGAELRKSQPFIQMSSMEIAFYDSIELKHSKSQLFSFLKTIQYQLFSNMLSPRIRGYSIAGIADMPASSNIIWMQNVQAYYFIFILSHAHV